MNKRGQAPFCRVSEENAVSTKRKTEQRANHRKERMRYAWTCNCCGQNFDTLPMNYAFTAPRNWFGLTEAERATRAKLTDDICIIDGTERYIRGCLEIPVCDSTESLVWGVWVSISEETLRYIISHWDDPLIEDEPPHSGWLGSWIKGYPEPVEIRCQIFIQGGDLRPRIVLQQSNYLLAIEQHQGITLERVKQIAASAGHV